MVFTVLNIQNFIKNRFHSTPEPQLVRGLMGKLEIVKGVTMTKNQIEYWNTQETKRHNRVTEGETGRHNLVTEGETMRHNTAGELETNRHNLVSEGIDMSRLNESIRHNMRTEGQTDQQLAELNRHNMASESIGRANVNLGYANLAESSRHNLATEGQTDMNLGIMRDTLSENIRHNVTTEDISRKRTEAQNALDEARTELSRVDLKWAEIKNQLSATMTKAEIDQIKQSIDESAARIDKINSDITRNKYANFESATKGAKSIVDTISKGIETSKDVTNLLDTLKVLKMLK